MSELVRRKVPNKLETWQHTDSEQLRCGNILEFCFHRIAYLKNTLAGFKQPRPCGGWHHGGMPPVKQFHFEFRF
jgi:hypothetical protein